MAKQFSTRIQNKIDVEENWSKATFTPLPGEFIIYAPDNNYSHSRLKIGDGDTPINSLPFLTYSAYDIAKALDPENTPDSEEDWLMTLYGTGITLIEPKRVTGGNGGQTDIYMHLSDGTSPYFPIYNGHGIDKFDTVQSNVNGGESTVDIELSDGRTKHLSIYNGQGIDSFSISKQSTENGGQNQIDIKMSNKENADKFIVYNGHGINKFEKKEVSVGNGGQTTIDVELSTGQKETLNIYNGEGIDDFKIIKTSEANGGENQIQFKLSNKTNTDTLSIYNGEGIDEFKITKQSTENGGENQFTIKMSNDPELKTFSVYNGEKGDKGTSIASINPTPITEGNGGTKVTITLDDDEQTSTNFSIYNGEVSDAQLNSIVSNITADLQLRSRSYSFDTTNEMSNWIQSLSTEQLNSLHLGDVFLIRDIGVPDYWWDPASTNIATISEYMDKDIVIEGKGACRILETSKLNLSGYCGLDQLENAQSAGIKNLKDYKIRVAEDGDEGRIGYITLIIPKGVE